MSLVKNKFTRYYAGSQDVRFRLHDLFIRHIDNLQKIVVRGRLFGRVGDAEGEVDVKKQVLELSDIQAGFSAKEKQAGRIFFAACERELAKKDVELATETHDDTDVFV